MPPKHEFPLRFSAEPFSAAGSYKLLELPSELCKVIESGLETQLTIRGRTSDDAVLCTSSRTYGLRVVTLSNTIVVATAPDAVPVTQPSELIVRDQVSQILELVPVVPRVHRLCHVLKGCEYEEGHERDEEDGEDAAEEKRDEEEERPRKRARFTRATIRGEIQASDEELAQAIKGSHILEIDGYLRPLTSSYLTHILQTLLTALVSEGFLHSAAPVQSLTRHLDLEHEIPRKVTEQILPWFGSVREGKAEGGEWDMDIKEVVKAVGLGRLAMHPVDSPAPMQEFIQRWKDAVGDLFAPDVDLTLLEGNYLLTPPPPAIPSRINYFPLSALPLTPTHLFVDLFLTRPRWRAQDIMPFLAGVAVDGKEKERLLMRYARATTGARDEGVWYTARATVV